MDTPTTAPVTPHKTRVQKRILIPGILITVVALLLVGAAVRGNWTDAEVRNPSPTENGVISQLIRNQLGRKEIRCAMIVAAPADRVWATVTDYDHFAEIFPNVTVAKGVRGDDGRWHLTGEVKSPVGRWPLDAHVQHAMEGSKFIASWDEPRGALKVNRGKWTVTPQGDGKTLLEYNLELEASPFPAFVVRAVLLDQLKPVLKAVGRRAEETRPL